MSGLQVAVGNPDLGMPAQWLFTEEDISNTPSVQHGMTELEERRLRAKGVNFIIQAGIMLKLPQLTLATASTFFHRFYMRASMVESKGGVHHYVCPHPAPLSLPSPPLTPSHAEHRSNGTLPRHEVRGELPQDQRNRHRRRQGGAEERVAHNRRAIQGVLALEG